MRILIATNGYPTPVNPSRQTFVNKIYTEMLKRLGSDKVGLIYNKYYLLFNVRQGSKNRILQLLKFIFLIISYLPTIIIHAKKYNLLYSHGVLMSATLMALASKLHNIKHICYVHGGDVNAYSKSNGLLHYVLKKTLKSCDYVLTNSVYMKENLKKFYDVDSDVITPGYDADIFLYKKTNRDTDILFAGNAIKRKGLDIFINAMKLNIEYYKKLNIKIFSDGEFKNEYLKQIKNNGLQDAVYFGDRLNPNELADEYKNSKIFVFPSRKEPLGLVGIEAIASGAILIASNTGGIKEYVKHGVNGYLFECENHNDLHSQIKFVLENYCSIVKKREEICFSVEHYSIQNGIDYTINIFNKIILSE